ncbi:MAG: hypothetical protein AAFR23_07095 [Pseudomonadota bacterium]
MSDATYEVVRLGDLGDGIAQARAKAGATASDTQPSVFIPRGLPGEIWSTPNDETFDCVQPHPDRVAPACKHFTRCGGCRAQHMPRSVYTAWKTDRVANALAQAGVGLNDNRPVADISTFGYGHRRRAVFTARRVNGAIALGYHARASTELIDIQMCPIATDDISRALATLKAIAAELAPDRDDIRLTVLSTTTGLDVSVDGAVRDPNAACRSRLSEIAEANGIVRLVVGKRDVVQFAQPALQVGSAMIVPASGTFVQASTKAEAAMIGRVVELAQAAKAKSVVDLFSGVGTFALALGARAHVTAIDGDQAALEALRRAANSMTGLKPIVTRHRDLFREPLAPKELSEFDVAVFDPPRAGARDQSERIAHSDVPTVIAVSCNPQTFARDAALLQGGGYVLEHVQPIDQFAFSEHVELVAHFSKPKRKTGGRRRRR